jgi:Holliday junction resolvase RusA-like endonuclease
MKPRSEAEIKVSLPWIPPTLNSFMRMHWRQQRAQNQIAALHMASAGLLPKSDPEIRRMKVTIQFFRKRPTDRDNALPKVILDALVRLGYLADDNEKWVECVVLPVKVDRKQPRTEIAIQALRRRDGKAGLDGRDGSS